MTDERDFTRDMARRFLERGDPTGWFDALYTAVEGDASRIPWADQRVNSRFAAWADLQRLAGNGRRALVVGCGLGDDAEDLARRGFQVTAFDVSPRAIAWCQTRFPQSSVRYQVANLLAPPREWQRAFDFVLEIYTLQALPAEVRAAAARTIVDSVAPGGTLLVIARGREPDEDPGGLPWPLTRAELAALAGEELDVIEFDDSLDDEDPPVRRFRVEYCRRIS